MKTAYIIDKLSGRSPNITSFRGDHDLNPDMLPESDLKKAAVLVPLVLREKDVTVLFTRRTEELEHHPGQVSFPGGHIDAIDNSAEDAALRETEEEVGLDRRHIEIIGRLDTYKTRTGFSVIPVVGLVRPPFDISPEPGEVAEVFEVPFSFLMNPDNHERHKREFQGRTREFYAMPYNGHFIWGATAGMVINLYDVLTND
jgi:8-oxo-dGTP pyrophosphatase MutT (NUDIX family)